MNNSSSSGGLTLSSAGFITWLVFLILKCCNLNNPDFNWLTWFWVWFPLWAPIALSLLVLSVFLLVFFISNHDK